MKTILFVSGKGGTGKTTMACLLSELLSEKHKVALFDADLTGPSVASVYGINNAPLVSSGMITPTNVNENLQVFSIGFIEFKSMLWTANAEAEFCINCLKTTNWDPETEYLIIDGSPGTGESVQALLNTVDVVLPVSEPTVVSVADCKKVINAANFIRDSNVEWVIINKTNVVTKTTVGKKEKEITVELWLDKMTNKEIEETLKTRILAEIPFVADRDRIKKEMSPIVEVVLNE